MNDSVQVGQKYIDRSQVHYILKLEYMLNQSLQKLQKSRKTFLQFAFSLNQQFGHHEITKESIEQYLNKMNPIDTKEFQNYMNNEESLKSQQKRLDQLYKQKKIHQPVIIHLTSKDGIFYLDDPKKLKKIKKNPENNEIKIDNNKLLNNNKNEQQNFNQQESVIFDQIDSLNGNETL